MLEHWIKPVENGEMEGFFVPRDAFGHSVAFGAEEYEGQRAVAIIGADPKWARRVRRQLYQFSARNRTKVVCDLGDFRKMHPEFVIPALKEILASDLLPVVIGARPDFSLTFLHTLQQSQPTTCAIFMHETIPSWTSAAPAGCRLHVVGTQQHLMSNHHVSRADKQNITYTRLGQTRKDVVSTEPMIRDAHFVSVDMSVLRYSDMPSQASHSTSGFFTEEACQLMRFAGMSPQVQAMALTGHDPMSMDHAQSANTVAQMVWYFVDGFHQRVNEFPGKTEHFTQYMVHLKDHDFDLSFHKSEKSGRWWVEVPGKRGSKLYSCAYSDYQSACEDVVSERIFTCMDQPS